MIPFYNANSLRLAKNVYCKRKTVSSLKEYIVGRMKNNPSIQASQKEIEAP